MCLYLKLTWIVSVIYDMTTAKIIRAFLSFLLWLLQRKYGQAGKYKPFGFRSLCHV